MLVSLRGTAASNASFLFYIASFKVPKPTATWQHSRRQETLTKRTFIKENGKMGTGERKTGGRDRTGIAFPTVSQNDSLCRGKDEDKQTKKEKQHSTYESWRTVHKAKTLSTSKEKRNPAKTKTKNTGVHRGNAKIGAAERKETFSVLRFRFFLALYPWKSTVVSLQSRASFRNGVSSHPLKPVLKFYAKHSSGNSG